MTLHGTPRSVRVFATTVLLSLGTRYGLALLYLYAKEVRPSEDRGIGVVEGVAPIVDDNCASCHDEGGYATRVTGPGLNAPLPGIRIRNPGASGYPIVLRG